MVDNTPHSVEAWIERISVQEMPALSSTIREMEKLEKDDTASLATLGQSVLHDHALTSAILKVANSASYMGRNPVTTLSRASVVLGLTTIKNICITAKLLNSLLKNKKLTPKVYERLLRLMAQSFHAGMIAKMMVSDYDTETQEETFIAALLNRFGESAFWSMGGQVTIELDEQLRQKQLTEADEVAVIVKQKLGATFEQMSIGLASSWNLGNVLIRSLEDPQLRTPELRSIHFAVRLSDTLANPRHTRKELNELFAEMAELMQVNEKEVSARVEQCTGQTIELLRSYGAGILTRYLNQKIKPQEDSDAETAEQEITGQALQLKILRELAFLPNENADFNMVIQTALEGIYRGINMRRAMVFLKSRDQKNIKPRFISAPDAEQIKQQFTIDINGMKNIFSHVLNTQQPVWVTDLEDPQWSQYLSKQIRGVVSDKGFFIAPVMWDTYCVGLFYADRSEQRGSSGQHDKLSQDDFMAFTLFVQQTNICLSLILKKSEK